ncbi:glycerol-3-phosphate acyltransferase [Marinobacterium nitratireducens]|uniref:Glycerol-3-phosphate acyltransferase n=1 Tax=Marinobacterium nitratireducens TaxID=518897 RepID=A0A917ZMU9_9GAMM|nr:glycerol-3-phosphate 1-O-acyltransferase PlsY [Marinobacterium nitratireducens]GGO85235.1 glycerol-3-phosphate acyltransferase [Marinobacterium nitratireducens]
MAESNMLTWAPLLALSYLLGCIPTAVVVCRALGIADPRRHGSGNPGATNVLRLGGPLAALLTLFGDLAKGASAVFLAYWAELTQFMAGLCGVAAVIGHLFPAFGQRHGGKGMATTFGVLLALSPSLGIVALASWVLIALLSKTASLASITTALVTPLATWLLLPGLLGAVLLISALLILRHHDNIQRLLAGEERRL